jgi:AcrR family transcriptional regulator
MAIAPTTDPSTSTAPAFSFVVIAHREVCGKSCAIRRAQPIFAPLTILACDSEQPPMPVRQLESDDPRVRRSERAVGAALLALIHERGFESITVQNILDRAGVARATFYAHYRNKDDVLYSGYEQLFAYLEAVLERPSSRRRLMPVAEFLSHLNRAGVFLDSLRAGKKLDEMLDLGTAFTARIIEVRLALTRGIRPGVPRSLLARSWPQLSWKWRNGGWTTARRLRQRRWTSPSTLSRRRRFMPRRMSRRVRERSSYPRRTLCDG